MAGLKKAFTYMNTDISNVIEEWIKEHPEDKMDKPFFATTDGKSYTLKEILREIRLQTPLGVEVAKNINKLTIDLLMRNKEKLS